MGSLDRSLSIAFGAVVLALLVLFLLVAAALSFQIQDRRQNFLATSLAQSVGQSVNRVNAYQMPDLVEELQDRIPGLGYVAVVDSNGSLLAHSRPGLAGRSLESIGLKAGDQDDLVWDKIHYWQRSLPLTGGLGDRVVGAILIGVSTEELRRDQASFLASLAGLCLVGALAAMAAVFLISRRFGGRVQSQLDRIIDKSPVGIAMTDLTTGKVLRTNEMFQKTYGYGRSDMPSLDRWFQRAYPDPTYRENIRSLWKSETEDSHRTGRPIPPLEVRLSTASGDERTVLVATALVGTTAVTTFVDRTEQHKAEVALIELNHSLEEKVRNRSEQIERMYRELVDTEKLAALGQLAAGMAHELNTPLGAIQSANGLNQDYLDRHFQRAMEFLLTLDAPALAFFWSLSKRNQGLVASAPALPDRTARRALLRELEALGWDTDEDLAEYILELRLERGEIETLASSEVLQAVFGLSRELLTLLRMTRVVSEGVSKAAHVVDALRRYLKGTEEDELVRFSLADQLETILTLFHHKLKHSVEVIRDLDPDAIVLGDRQRLNQVWMNLVHNALQAMEFKGTLRLCVRRRPGAVLVEVADSGPGIPDTVKDRIFEPYFTTKKRGEGLGLGLDLCRKILQDHQGSITFESRPGATQFSVVLPVPEEF